MPVRRVLEELLDRSDDVIAEARHSIQDLRVKDGREGHWGLSGMRERAAAIHGRLRILSMIGAGTEVVILVPRIYASVK